MLAGILLRHQVEKFSLSWLTDHCGLGLEAVRQGLVLDGVDTTSGCLASINWVGAFRASLLLLGLLSGKLDALNMVVVPIESELYCQVLEMLNRELEWRLRIVRQWIELQWLNLSLCCIVNRCGKLLDGMLDRVIDVDTRDRKASSHGRRCFQIPSCRVAWH